MDAETGRRTDKWTKDGKDGWIDLRTNGEMMRPNTMMIVFHEFDHWDNSINQIIVTISVKK